MSLTALEASLPANAMRARADRPSVHTRFPTILPPNLQRILARGIKEMASPFRGITTNGTTQAGLYKLAPTGVSTKPMVEAAQKFLSALDERQRRHGVFALDSDWWRGWCNVHPYLMRHGQCLVELDEHQREAAHGLLRASLGERGYRLARDIMKLNYHLRELSKRPDDYGEWFYWLSIFGTPSPTEPWGWQIDGHHLIVNCLVLGDQVVLTPNFFGSEPVVALSGQYAGTRVFQDEEATGAALMQSLTPQQQRQAVVGDTLPRDVFASAFNDNAIVPDAGVRYADLAQEQRQLLRDILNVYIERLPPGQATVKRAEVEQHIERTTFGWIGTHDENGVFYYRVYNPVILCEFTHQYGLALGDDGYTRNHIHTTMRTPNGNDYGKELLRQYRAQRAD